MMCCKIGGFLLIPDPAVCRLEGLQHLNNSLPLALQKEEFISKKDFFIS
jgi:hypothetical protein